ncbi:MAG: hypothetical protein JW785_09710 [Acidimicrobiia bacterium]|nr:hypothetical protein [Acidimicrobiia bacterium]
MTGSDSGTERRRRAYQVGGRHTREAIAREMPDVHELLERVAASDIVVVRGQYDHVEWVLESLGLPHLAVDPQRLAEVALRPEQLLVINCPGQVGAAAVAQVRRFVTAGGSLFTTDWALRHVLEPAFPGAVAYNQRPTADAVVRVQAAAHNNPFLKGVMDGADDPIWWLEGSSYPIVVLDPSRVEILISSRELAERWGEAPVAVSFRAGAGEVFHMISHYYLQRTETRTRRHRMPAAAYAAEKGVAWDAQTAAAAADLSLGEVEAASSSARLFANVVGEKRRRAAQQAPRDGAK